MSDIKLCQICSCDISHRYKSAKYCIQCGIDKLKTIRKEINQKTNIKRREKTKQKTRLPKPTSCIRAITPVASEIGKSSRKGIIRQEDKVREITPSPVLADQPFKIRSDKKTWIFPKTEKRYNDLLNR